MEGEETATTTTTTIIEPSSMDDDVGGNNVSSTINNNNIPLMSYFDTEDSESGSEVDEDLPALDNNANNSSDDDDAIESTNIVPLTTTSLEGSSINTTGEDTFTSSSVMITKSSDVEDITTKNNNGTIISPTVLATERMNGVQQQSIITKEDNVTITQDDIITTGSSIEEHDSSSSSSKISSSVKVEDEKVQLCDAKDVNEEEDQQPSSSSSSDSTKKAKDDTNLEQHQPSFKLSSSSSTENNTNTNDSDSTSNFDEAERQAAIAAAIAANSNSMSPSVAAGIAKVLASPAGSIMVSDSVNELGDMTTTKGSPPPRLSSAGAGGYPPPPPPPRNNNEHQYNNNSPTMVALPPISSTTPPGPSSTLPMRPVRFEDVKFAFNELLVGKKEKKKKNVMGDDDESKVVDDDSLEKKKEEKAEEITGESTDETETTDDVGGEEKSNDGEKEDETSEENKSETSTSSAKVSSTSTTIQSSPDINDTTTSIPDSFLRFLLLVARVPIIVEEFNREKKSSPSNKNKGVPNDGDTQTTHSSNDDDNSNSDKKTVSVPQAATSAAKRAFEILCMIQSSYELISDSHDELNNNNNNNSLDNSSSPLKKKKKRRVMDATTTFFAACAGEKSSDTDSLVDGCLDTSTMKKIKGNVVDTAIPLNNNLPQKSSPRRLSSSTASTSTGTPLTAASSMASSVLSNVLSKMATTKKQTSFSDIGKKFMNAGSGHGKTSSPSSPQHHPSVHAGFATAPSSLQSSMHQNSNSMEDDYEILINNEMLGLTVENVLERTIIRTLLADGAAKHAGAQVGSLIAKVGNVDTSNLTHFETIDELRRSQRPLKLTLRHVGADTLRRAREEMGRLIRGHGLTSSSSSASRVDSNPRSDNKPWKGSATNQQLTRQQPVVGETFDAVLNNRWPSRSNKSLLVSGASASASPLAMTRGESMHQASKNLIRILALLLVGLQKELDGVESSTSAGDDSVLTLRPHLTVKELREAIDITSKILLDYARSQPDIDDKNKQNRPSGGAKTNSPGSSSFYPVPPGRVQGKKHGAPPNAGRGAKGQRGKKQPSNSPLLRIGDALQRTRSFLVESNSVTATALRWEIIDYLCVVLDLDTEQELSEKESVSSSTEGGEAGSPTNDLGAAGSILKLIVLNCSTVSSSEDATSVLDGSSTDNNNSDSELSSLDQSSRSIVDSSMSGNPFLSVVHRLAASKSTSARVSACSLGPVLWNHLDFPRQLQLRGVITRALHDVEVIVRKSTAAVLHEIAELVFDRRAVPWLVLMCERSMTDPEPQLRAAAMTLTWHLAEHLPNAFLGDASKGSRSLRRLPPRDSPTFMDVYLLQCKLLPVANNLAEDRIATVRLSVAAQCDRLCNALGEHWFNIIIDLLQALLSDADDRVRSEAILCMPRLVESVILGTSNSDNITVLESLLPLAVKIQKDTSPMVRSSLAAATGELLIFLVGLGSGSTNSIPEPSSPGRVSPGQPPPSPGGRVSSGHADHKKHVDDTLIPILQKLLQDSDPEVTTASLRAVTNASRSGARDTASTRIPSCSHSQIDDDLVSLSSHHSHQSHASFERTKPVFIPVLSEKQVLRLLPTLSNLATSTQWRVRQSAVEIVPALMGCTHRHETRHEISKLCLRLMNDKVDAVRKTAAECLCLGGSSLARHGVEDGGEWIKKIVIPHLRTCSQSDDSKQRLLSLKMIEIIITNGLVPRAGGEAESVASSPRPSPRDDDESTSSSIITETERPIRTILSIAASHTSDNVANVRLNVGRTFDAIMLLLDRSEVDFAVETLEKQLEEETSRPGGGDRDVIYFANQAIQMAKPIQRRSST